MEDAYLLNPIMAEGVNVSIRDLAEVYNTWGLVQLNLLIQARNLEAEAEADKAGNNNQEDM